MGHVNGPLPSGSCNRQASGGGCCGCCCCAAVASATAAALAFLWNPRCQNQPCFYLLYAGTKYKGLTSVLSATCTVRSGSALILAVRFLCTHSLNNPGHCCNLAAISLSRKKINASLMDRSMELQTWSLGKLDFNKMLIKYRTSEEAKSAVVTTSYKGGAATAGTKLWGHLTNPLTQNLQGSKPPWNKASSFPSGSVAFLPYAKGNTSYYFHPKLFAPSKADPTRHQTKLLASLFYCVACLCLTAPPVHQSSRCRASVHTWLLQTNYTSDLREAQILNLSNICMSSAKMHFKLKECCIFSGTAASVHCSVLS